MTGRLTVTGRRIAAGVAVAVAAAGCSAGNGVFSRGSVTGCFRALPAAESALHDPKARLLGVHLVPADRLPGQVRSVVPPEDDAAVCAVAFSGVFAAGQVTGAAAKATGRYAVVLVDVRHPKVVGSFVGDRLPKGLRGHLIS